MANRYKQSPKGMAMHAYIHTPDAKFNPENPQFKTKLVVEGEDATKFREIIDAAVDHAYAEEMEKLPLAQRKLWGKAYPYEDELDRDTGEPTGRTIFKFKQNAFIRRKGQDPKPVKILVVDSQNKRGDIPVFTGDIIRVGYTTRTSVLGTAKQISVRLDFGQIQVLEKRQSGGDSVFDTVEGGWTAEDNTADDFDAPASPAGTSNGDF